MQGEAASGDEKAASEFPKALAEIIREGGYSVFQVFNVDETGLFWKCMPNRMYIAKEKSAPGHKVSKERLTLLLGGNAAGDFKLKPCWYIRLKIQGHLLESTPSHLESKQKDMGDTCSV